ncbi:MAG TPA: YHS domain-containing protein [Patescibacteria group bacterium]|nr:YHS domain-containing protein [Patescibacteria group bacterium]
MTDRPTHLIDPVCGMTVEVATAEEDGRLLERDGRTYAFCRSGCRRAFLEDPEEYIAKAQAATATSPEHAHPEAGGLPVIDEGIRRWYESCACCLGDTYPEIKAQLDAERAAASAAPVDPGICEVAEAEPAVPVG